MAGLRQDYNVVVMYARPYSMLREDTGEVNEGISCEYYFFGENGEFLKAEVSADGSDELGIRRSKCSLPIGVQPKLSYVPGVYNGKFEMTVNKDGKPSLKMVDVDFIGKCMIALDAGAAGAPGAPGADTGAAGADPEASSKSRK